LDELVSTTVSSQLSKHPTFRKTVLEILRDVEKSAGDTKVWKIGAAVVERMTELLKKFRPRPDEKGVFLKLSIKL
jgi:hypothetical protein